MHDLARGAWTERPQEVVYVTRKPTELDAVRHMYRGSALDWMRREGGRGQLTVAYPCAWETKNEDERWFRHAVVDGTIWSIKRMSWEEFCMPV